VINWKTKEEGKKQMYAIRYRITQKEEGKNERDMGSMGDTAKTQAKDNETNTGEGWWRWQKPLDMLG